MLVGTAIFKLAAGFHRCCGLGKANARASHRAGHGTSHARGCRFAKPQSALPFSFSSFTIELVPLSKYISPATWIQSLAPQKPVGIVSVLVVEICSGF